MTWLDVYHMVLDAARFPIRWEVMIGVRVAVTLGLLIASHALIRSYVPSRIPTVGHIRGVAYTVLAVGLFGGSLLSGQSRAPGLAYQFVINGALCLWVFADVLLIGKRRYLNRVRRSRKGEL